MTNKHWTMIVPGAVLLCASPAFSVELRDAVQSALNTNPEIRQAVSNRVATQEERVQGQGLYYPRISVEGSAGVRRLKNPTRRRLDIAGDTLYPMLEITELKPGRTTGVVDMKVTIHNQTGDLVMDGTHKYLVRKKPA